MKKQNAQMLLLITILILCICGYFIVKSIPEETEVISESYTVSSVAQEEVIGMSYLYEGNIVDLIKEKDTWTVKDNEELSLDQSIIENMLGYVCSITTDTKIDSPEALADYGLSNPSNTICLTLKDESVVQLLIGDYIDMTGEYYVLLAGDANVYTISSYIPVAFEKSVDELIAEEETTEAVTAEEETTEVVTAEEETTEPVEDITEESIS